jgi:hypothetical protein
LHLDEPPPKENDVLTDTFATLSKGFSFFASKATEVARVAVTEASRLGSELNENVIKPTTQKIQDPSFRQNVSTGFQQFGRNVRRLTATILGLYDLCKSIYRIYIRFLDSRFLNKLNEMLMYTLLYDCSIRYNIDLYDFLFVVYNLDCSIYFRLYRQKRYS